MTVTAGHMEDEQLQGGQVHLSTPLLKLYNMQCNEVSGVCSRKSIVNCKAHQASRVVVFTNPTLLYN